MLLVANYCKFKQHEISNEKKSEMANKKMSIEIDPEILNFVPKIIDKVYVLFSLLFYESEVHQLF